MVVGPTGVGKTALAIHLASRLHGEVVSADSRQLYRGMDIGTAKPSAEEQIAAVHHLVDVADPDDPWSVTRFQEAAQRVIADIHVRGKLPILAGGTGQYVFALVEAWQPPVNPPDTRLRRVLEAWAAKIGAQELHRKLALLDPPAGARVDPTNLRRIIRALEVILSSGCRFSAQIRSGESPYDTRIIGVTLERPQLYSRIDRRIEDMLAAGFLEEVRGLLAKGFDPASGPLSAIGYREMTSVLRGEMTLEEAGTRMKRLTRRYIRQQYNWFRLTDPRITWFEAEDGFEDKVVQYLIPWLSD